jgi:hypothetical protein
MFNMMHVRFRMMEEGMHGPISKHLVFYNNMTINEEKNKILSEVY